jgi:CRP-like cAMP-binding protein
MQSWRWGRWVADREQLRRLRLLEQVPLFAGLGRRHLGAVLVKLFQREYEAGETIFLAGEPGKALYIVLDGTVLLYHQLNGHEHPVATMTPGSYFGELALIDTLPRAASARAVEPSRLLIFYKSHFDQLIEGRSAIALTVMGNLLKTLAGYIRGAAGRPGDGAGSPLQDPGPPPSPNVGVED